MINKKTKLNIYLIGIKGVGMTMLAQFLAKQGHSVSGSDIVDTFLTDQVLKRQGIKVFSPFSVRNVPDKTDLIVYSSAFTPVTNVELAFIKENPSRFKNVPLMSYAACLGEVFNSYTGVAVCGSHGKTTTSAWLGYVLSKAGQEPNVLVGSRVPQFKASALMGKSKYFIAEVDEYQNKLQYFNPRGVVLNNIEFDHPDFFKDEAAYAQVFADFLKKIPVNGFLVANYSDEAVRKISKHCRGKIVTYDVDFGERSVPTVNYLAYNLQIKNGQLSFAVNNLGRFSISLFGHHNVYNALAVIAAARELKVSLEDIRKHLKGFKGTDRRAQILGSYKGALIIDDYAHHPSEIKSTLAGLRDHYPNKKIVTVFHPHTYTRTKALFKDFVTSFSEADELIILDIYGSAREKQGGVSSRQLAAAISKYNRLHKIKQSVVNISTIFEVATNLKKHLQKNDLLILMGAGDVFRVGEIILKKEVLKKNKNV